MAAYHFVTTWKLRAPLDAVWQAILETEKWPSWWKGVVSVQQVRPPGQDGLGGVQHMVWRSRLPYNLAFDMETTRREPKRIIGGRATGELVGTGVWEMRENDGVTTVRYTWDVDTSRPWMNLLRPIARPLFAWNHDYVMRAGGVGLAKLLGAELIAQT